MASSVQVCDLQIYGSVSPLEHFGSCCVLINLAVVLTPGSTKDIISCIKKIDVFYPNL